MSESTENIQEYIEEIDAIIEEYNSLDPEEKEDSKEFHDEVLKLRKGFDEFESCSEEDQEKLIQSAEALFFSISLFSDLEDEDLEDLTEWDEDDDFDEDFDSEEIDIEQLQHLSGILAQFTESMEADSPEQAEEMKNKLQALLSNINSEEISLEEPEEKTISITES